ncbi:long-chain fatty acid--CoA ligase [Nanoarchaeota archaeon]|nr:MAG: long-chain fatty acid--CoA ligase [Nanoarchaeota archaeon]
MAKWSVGKIISKRALWTPDKVALIYEDQPITYGRLALNVNRAANLFKSVGLKKGDRIGVLLKNCPEFIEVYFAAAMLGIIFVPINFRLVGPEIKYQLSQSNCRALVFGDFCIDEVASIRHELEIEDGRFFCVSANFSKRNKLAPWAEDYRTAIESQSSHEPEIEDAVDLHDPLCIMYTSGVTGRPKGAVLSHGQTYFKCLQMFLYTDMRNDDVFLSQAPLCHSAGLFIAATPVFCHGATLIMRRDFRPDQFALDIERYKVTIIFAMTTMWRMILETGKLDEIDTQSVRVVIGGGERTPPQLVEELVRRGIHVQAGYGQTESHFMCFLPKQDILRKMGSVGLPGFLTDVWVINEEGRKARPGEIGEIVARGPNVMSEYWQMPDETEKTIINGVIHTGDLGYQDEEGYFYIVGRKKDMYRSGGENVYPAEIEQILLDHPKIENVAIIGVPDEKWGETGKAFIVVKKGEKLDKEEVLRFLEGKIARYKLPRHIQFVEELPLTASGKIKKSELAKKERNGRAGQKGN